MVDLSTQYLRLKDEIDAAIEGVLSSAQFIGGNPVSSFSDQLANISSAKFAVTCGNGTDALQIALMALDIQPGDEVIVPSFTYIATAEVIALLRAVPVFVDVDSENFNIAPEKIQEAITAKTKAIIVVHLYGQCAPMEAILSIANEHNIAVIEDGAQSIGAEYRFQDGRKSKSGGMGMIGSTSFYPSKNLGAYGDGGAVTTSDELLYQKMKLIANHGQTKKYHHEIVGINSRLDTIQAAILSVKLKHLPDFEASRQRVADRYDKGLRDIEDIQIPKRESYSSHVFHQYTLKLGEGIDRDKFQTALAKKGIPSVVYYPIPQHQQKGFQNNARISGDLTVSDSLSKSVISLPMHTELTDTQIDYVCENLKEIRLNGELLCS